MDSCSYARVVLAFVLLLDAALWISSVSGDGCSRKFNGNTVLSSPTRLLIEEAPEAIMFWIYPLNSSSFDERQFAKKYNSNDETHIEEINDSSDPDFSQPETGVIFDTGDYVDPRCACNQRLVLVYRYDDQAIEAQTWSLGSQGWECDQINGVADIPLALWTHVIYYTSSEIFYTNGVESSNQFNVTALLRDADEPYASMGKSFIGNIDEIRVYNRAIYFGDTMPHSWMYGSLCDMSSDLLLYFNFDECEGISVHNTAHAAPSSCWTCKQANGKLCYDGLDVSDWDESIVETQNCTQVPPICRLVDSSDNDSKEFLGISIYTYFELGGAFLIALLVCGTLAAYLGKRYRRFIHQKYQRIGNDNPPSPKTPAKTSSKTPSSKISSTSPSSKSPKKSPSAIIINESNSSGSSGGSGGSDGSDGVDAYYKAQAQAQAQALAQAQSQAQEQAQTPGSPGFVNSLPTTPVANASQPTQPQFPSPSPATVSSSVPSPTSPRTAAVASQIASIIVNGSRPLPAIPDPSFPHSSPHSIPRAINANTTDPTSFNTSLNSPRKISFDSLTDRHHSPHFSPSSTLSPPHSTHGPLRKTNSTGHFHFHPPTTPPPPPPTATTTTTTADTLSHSHLSPPLSHSRKSTSTSSLNVTPPTDNPTHDYKPPLPSSSSSSSSSISIPSYLSSPLSTSTTTSSPRRGSSSNNIDIQPNNNNTKRNSGSSNSISSDSPPSKDNNLTSKTDESTQPLFGNNTPIGNVLAEATPESPPSLLPVTPLPGTPEFDSSLLRPLSSSSTSHSTSNSHSTNLSHYEIFSGADQSTNTT